MKLLKGVPTTMKVFLYEPKLEDMVGDLEPHVDDREQLYDGLVIDDVISRLSPQKQVVVRALVNGDNFSQIGHDLNLKQGEIYKIKDELKKDLAYLLEGRQSVLLPFDDFIKQIKKATANVTLSQFIKVFVGDYEKVNSNTVWQVVAADQAGAFTEWENSNGNIQFEDWHTKAVVVAGYLLRMLFLRNKVISIDYYHNNKQFLIALVKNIRAMIRVSPILRYDLAYLKVDDDFMLKFEDGSAVRSYHQRGRKPNSLGNFVVVDDGGDEINGNEALVKGTCPLIKSIFKQINPTFITVSNNFN